MPDSQLFQLLLMMLGALGVVMTAVGSWIALCIQRLTDSIGALNEKMAVVVNKVDTHETRIVRLEERKG